MMDMQVCIRGLNADGIAEWFRVPVSEDEVMARLKIHSDRMYVIEDYCFPVPVDYYASVDDVNYMYDQLMQLETNVYLEDVEILCNYFYLSLDELADVATGGIRCWLADTMAAVAETMVRGGHCGEMPVWLCDFIKYAEMGDDLQKSGRFVPGKKGIYEMILR